MSSLALMEVQRALYGKLTADGVLMGMVSGIYDVVPQRAMLPYIILGDGDQAVLPAEGLQVTECKLNLHIWTETGGRKTALAIMNRVHALIHLGTLNLSGFQLVTLRTEEAKTSLIEQGTYLSGVLSVLITVVEA